MEADRTLSAPARGRLRAALPPGGAAFAAASLGAALRESAPADALRGQLAAALGGARLRLFASGREALRSALVELARGSSRREVVLPAYTCFSVASAVVAAGLRVRLVDQLPGGGIDAEALARLPLDGALALVATNLFGVPEPLAGLRRLTSQAGLALIDDAAQCLGARCEGAAVGTRGELGILSFGRGKPLEGLGGGALIGPKHAGEGSPEPPPAPAARAAAVLRALGYGLALQPAVFGPLAGISALKIGETHFDPGFRRGGIDGASQILALARLADWERSAAERHERALALAARLRAETQLIPLLARDPGDVGDPGDRGAYPRLALLAPDAATRSRLLAELQRMGAGASAMYPSTLDVVPALAEHLAAGPACPGSEQLCQRLITLPTHAGLSGPRLDAVLRVCSQLHPRGRTQHAAAAPSR